jgi:serine/threonine protein kinase
MTIVRLSTHDGKHVEYVDTIAAQGGMKDVYFSPDKSYVVAFFRDKLDFQGKERLKAIVGSYREGILEKEGGTYWAELFRWPTGIVEKDGRVGVVVPAYKSCFFFSHGSVNGDILGIKGHEKKGKWFASASNRRKYLPPEEKGSWLTHLQVCLSISRAVRRLHAAGLAHSDLSYNNVLVDPVTGQACVIDIDTLVVPNKYPPGVVGTPDFIAPEVVETQSLDRSDPRRKLPSSYTDRHALSVLIYVYLLYRHPLRGSKIHDFDAAKDEELMMGSAALFIEHPTNTQNRVKEDQISKAQQPWGDPHRMPYSITGPYLSDLFEKAFIGGLHDSQKRPTASDWENAIIKTIDLLQPCAKKCEMGWYVFDNTTRPCCPYCRTPYLDKLAVLNLYSCRRGGNYKPDNHRVMVWDGQSLFPWHANRFVFPGEKLSADQKKRVGYFRLHKGDWFLVNTGLLQMFDVVAKRDVPVGDKVKLTDGGQILLSREDGGRLVQVQLVN